MLTRFKKMALTLQWVGAVIGWLNKYYSVLIDAINEFPPFPSEGIKQTEVISKVEKTVNSVNSEQNNNVT